MTNRAVETWDDLKQLLRWFGTLFGQPTDLYASQVVKKPHGLLIRGWIAGLEAMARALLMTMAAELPRPEATPQPAKAKLKRRAAKAAAKADVALGVIDVPDSERWADVRFVLVPRKPASGARRQRDGLPKTMMMTRPLAYRLEALIRVVEKPEHYARRLAVRLHAKPDLAFRILRQPHPTGCASFPRDDVGRAQGLGWLAYDTFAANTG